MFVAINYITCNEEYKEQFEMLFATQAKTIDTMTRLQRREMPEPLMKCTFKTFKILTR